MPVLRSGAGQYTELDPIPAAPGRPIETIDGTVLDLGAHRGRLVVLNFWATWCPGCVVEMPSLDRLAMADQGLAILPVCMDKGGRIAAAAFYRRHGLSTLPLITDPAEHIGHFRTGNPNEAPFALHAMPITYLIDPWLQVRGYVPGVVDWQSGAAAALLQALSAE